MTLDLMDPLPPLSQVICEKAEGSDIPEIDRKK